MVSRKSRGEIHNVIKDIYFDIGLGLSAGLG